MNSFCPICKKASVFKYRPFCSKRCADVDLARWLRGDYKIEGEATQEKQKDGSEEE
ncbi:MAG: hypothetical protein ACD_16C00120G0006 [uncultured bacterium]|nr:MAG: hypothetical protein ACD_16C00120G0006 [uncultured bacterium]OFW73809.1 MAG: DNA gyrase inhibitor YacG [Alphaproteobacteria bacterium GWA2_41_27]OFW93129.1 MAG: DNA gyrase inhibitor YacG [Alphaproteobacteria bacterium RIFCSPHIGHO2_12_42_13]HBG34602.1 DNA gyrase inhibitor YacG [Holosporales bacterium]HBW24776.1 DNA gyrase inhibitor YacG [Holosporales bacterium]